MTDIECFYSNFSSFKRHQTPTSPVSSRRIPTSTKPYFHPRDRYLMFNSLLCPNYGRRLSYLFFSYSNFFPIGWLAVLNRDVTFGRDDLKHTQPSECRVCCSLTIGETKGVIDIAHCYRSARFGFVRQRTLYRNGFCESSRPTLSTAYTCILLKIHKCHLESHLSSHNAPFNCVLIDNHFPKHGKGFFRLR